MAENKQMEGHVIQNGCSLYEFNALTGVILKAEKFNQDKPGELKSVLQYVVKNDYCFYVSALNMKNARKKFILVINKYMAEIEQLQDMKNENALNALENQSPEQ